MPITDIPYEFIRQQTDLDWREIKFGLDHHLIKSKMAIDQATEKLCRPDAMPKEVVELASLTENDPTGDLVALLAKNEASGSEEQVKAKWLYLSLAWLFENRESLVDPLALVEMVYSDFDYPKEIASFVRYMPMDGPDLGNREQNEARMFDRWKTYLKKASRRFGREGSTTDTGE